MTSNQLVFNVLYFSTYAGQLLHNNSLANLQLNNPDTTYSDIYSANDFFGTTGTKIFNSYTYLNSIYSSLGIKEIHSNRLEELKNILEKYYKNDESEKALENKSREAQKNKSEEAWENKLEKA
ncbi:23129_t:CDS:1 [Dentiscutata erythropus]|uniref:23129_t:CDS:1 n=1 Tax=Dentiscutata erythropus TaxID=1348616 RepID=A0A9N8YVN4_9GLOM|nr:23129_t:CDS:1 [Dentiscutata erythropus]